MSGFHPAISLRLLVPLGMLLGGQAAHAQGPVLIQEVISREVGLFTGANPDAREVISREVVLMVGENPAAREIVSREVSLVLSDAAPPPAIPALAITTSPNRDAVTLDWSAYDQWSVRDVAAYAVYYANEIFTSTTGMTPILSVPGETFTTTLTGLPVFEDFFFAVVPIDALGHAIADVTPTGNYALTKEIISREVTLLNGGEGTPQYKELVSREVSLLLSDTPPPPPVTNLSFTNSPTGKDVTLNWDGYDQWTARDVSFYQIFLSDTPFTSVAGMTPVAVVNGENFSRSFTDLTPWRDQNWAVVAVDGQGNRNPQVESKGVYIISPQAISREVALFVGHEPSPPLSPEVVSREVSLVVASPEVPEPVTGIDSDFAVNSSITQYGAVDADWSSYGEWAQRDVARYRIYVGTSFFDDVSGLTPYDIVADGTQQHTIIDLSPEQIHFVAVVAEDVNLQFNPTVYARSVKASVGELGDVSNVLASTTPSTITYTWDLSGVGTNREVFVKKYHIYFNGAITPLAVGPAVRTWTATSLDFGTTYAMRITTVDVFGKESTGVTVVATTPTIPPGDLEVAWNPGADGPVSATVMQSADQMIVMGGFTHTGGEARNRIARLNPEGTVDAAFDPDANGVVRGAAMQADGKMLVFGEFTGIAGVTRTGIVRLLADGALDTGFHATPNGAVSSVAVQADGSVVLCGDFTQVNDIARNRVARVTLDGTLDDGFDPNANDSVMPVILQADGKIVIGGAFTTVRGEPRNRIARLNADGTLDAAFNPGVDDNSVQTLLLQPDGKILIGGSFTSIGGVTRKHLARLLTTGALDSAYDPDVNGDVWSLVRQTNDQTLVGGAFTMIGTTPRNRAARLLDDGTLDPVFDPDANGTVYGVMLQPDGKIILAGGDSLTGVGGQPRSRLARLHNNPASNTLAITNISQLTWQRGGTSAETPETWFDVSSDGGQSWLALGSGTRVNGGWELNGTELPPLGILRARARACGGIHGASSGLSENRLVYNVFTTPESWRQFYFNTPNNTGIAADEVDADADGLSNLIERAFGQDPGNAGSRALPVWQWTPFSGTVSFDQPAGITGMVYTGEWSTTLAADDWHAIPDSGIGGHHTFTIALNGAPRMFVRIKVYP